MRFLLLCLLSILSTSGFSQNLPKDWWKVVAVDSEEKNEDIKGSGFASCIIDNDINTFWTTGFKTQHTPFPHYVVVDLGGIVSLNGFVFYPRQKRYQDKISNYKIYIGQDTLHWKLIHEDKFHWKDSYDYSSQSVTLPKKEKGRYIKFEVLKPVLKTDNCIHLAEMDIQGIYLTPFLTPKIHVKKDTIVENEVAEFIDSSFVENTRILSREWRFPGGTPSVSFKQNPTVRYNTYGKYNASLTIRSQEGIKKTIFLKNIVTYLPAPELRRSNWKISVSEQECNMSHDTATNIIDNNPKTMWHTFYFNGKKLPHFVLVDLGENVKISAIGYLPRQTGSVNGIFSSYRVYVSNDTANFGKEVTHVKESKPYRGLRIIKFPTKSGRYLKIVIDKSFPSGKDFASASELYVYGKPVKHTMEWIITGLLLTAVFIGLFVYWRRKNQDKKKINQKDENDYSSDKKVKIYLFGRFQLINKGQEIDQLFNKLMQIFALITYHSIESSGIITTELNRRIWADLPDENISRARGTNIGKLRNALQNVSSIEIVSERKLWKLQWDDELVYIDFRTYRELYLSLSEGLKTNQFSTIKLSKLLNIIKRGRFLDNFETEWADELKNKISEEIIDLLKNILSKHFDKLTKDMIILVCDCLFLQDELSVEALRTRLQLYQGELNHGLAKKTYDTYCRKYRQIYNEEFPTSFTSFIQE